MAGFATATVRIDVDHAEVANFLHSPSGPVWREIDRLGRETQALATQLAPKDTAELAASITHRTSAVWGAFVISAIGSRLDYAIWVHEGTGIYGRGTPIVPVRAKMLRFEPSRRTAMTSLTSHAKKGTRGMVFAKSVKGQRGNPFLVRALEYAVPFFVVTTATPDSGDWL